MAHNAFIHGGVGNAAAYPNGYVLTQLDYQTLDQRQFESINGDQGGAWAPINKIVIGGAGTEFSAGVTFDVTATAVFNGTVVVNGSSFFQAIAGGSVSMYQRMDVYGGSGGEIDVHSSSRIYMDAGSEFTMHKDAFSTIDCSVDIGDSSQAASWTFNDKVAVSFNGPSNTVAFNNQSTTFDCSGHFGATSLYNYSGTSSYLSGSIIGISDGAGFYWGGKARINRTSIPLSNAGQNVAVTDGFYFNTPGLGGSVNYLLVTTGAQTGDEMEFYATNASNDGILKDNLGNQLAVFRNGTVGKDNYARVRFNGTNWILINKYTQ